MERYILLGEGGIPFLSEISYMTGATVRVLPSFDKIGSPVSSHADSLIYPLADSLLMHRDYYEENKELFSSLPFSVLTTDEEFSKGYPRDILFNALSVGSFVIGRCDRISKYILKEKTAVQARQGYARCSVLLLNNAAVTADKTIARALLGIGIDTLLIQSGHIALDGCEYGFIGGASFVFDKTVYFFGDINTHPDCDMIVDFLSSHGYAAHSLSKDGLTDIGGAVIICKKTALYG